jgi:hypothetical protein
MGNITVNIAKQTPSGPELIRTIDVASGRTEREVNLVSGEYLIYRSSEPNVHSRLVVEPRQ